MNEFILYLLKASLGILVFYLVYWATLRKETFFKANRLFLVSSLLVSLILPFIGFSYTSHVSNSGTGNIFVELNKNFGSITNLTLPTNTSNTGISWQNALLYIYLTGLIIFLIRLVWQCTELVILISKHSIRTINGLSIVENNKYGLPFSFFNFVFINPNFHSGTDLTNILAHEKVHIRQHHWFDLLIVELFTVVFWFNPFVWLFERSIKQNHEYLADEGVLAQGFSIGRYQTILINQIMGMQIIGLTNNLNYSLNKKRMKMMTKMKTPKIRAFRMIWALPAVALLLAAFAKPSTEMEFRSHQFKATPSDQEIKNIVVYGKVLNDNGVPMNGVSVVLGGTSIGATTNENGLFSIKMSKTDKLYVSFIGYVTIVEGMNFIEKSEKVDGIYKPVFKMKAGIINLEIDKLLREKPLENEKSTTNKSDKDELFIIVEQMPNYPGGTYALATEISDNIQKIKDAKQTNGKVIVGFTVDETGKVINIQTLEKGNESAARQAEKIISGLKQWTPGKQRGKAVPVNYSIEINFN